jgi:dTDP-4-dehydrorhamnose 3,5-epimerase
LAEFRRLSIPDLIEIRPNRHGDARGFVSEVWSRDTLSKNGIDLLFVQDNHSYSAARGVLRGLHFQLPPFAQAKLVRVARGAVFDVAVDLRRGSPTFAHWAGLILSATEWNQLLIPAGFAHGFVTLEPDCEVLYKSSASYSPEHERGIRYDDPGIGIDWPIRSDEMILSEKDRAAPQLADAEPDFVFEQPE